MTEMDRIIKYRLKDSFILPVGIGLGETEIIYKNGLFEVWRSRSTSIWDASTKERVMVPAAYRIIRRLPATVGAVNGKIVSCRAALVMRVVIAHVIGWRGVRDELISQVDMIACRRAHKGGKDD